ncbi:unnamed protein product [Musa textilis]
MPSSTSLIILGYRVLMQLFPGCRCHHPFNLAAADDSERTAWSQKHQHRYAHVSSSTFCSQLEHSCIVNYIAYTNSKELESQLYHVVVMLLHQQWMAHDANESYTDHGEDKRLRPWHYNKVDPELET